jgi:hypothetical protein
MALRMKTIMPPHEDPARAAAFAASRPRRISQGAS